MFKSFLDCLFLIWWTLWLLSIRIACLIIILMLKNSMFSLNLSNIEICYAEFIVILNPFSYLIISWFSSNDTGNMLAVFRPARVGEQ